MLSNSPFRFPDGSLKPIAGGDDTPDDDDSAEPGDSDGDGDGDVADPQDNLEDNDGDGDDDDPNATGADGGDDDNKEGGSGAGEGDEPKPDVVKPTGAEILELLAGDPDAQQLMQATMQQMLDQNAASAAAEEERQELQSLIEKGDYAEVGRRVVERSQQTKTREEVASSVLEQEFKPVYLELFAAPELKDLTPEEKTELAPNKFASDAAFVRALQAKITEKQFEKKIESEVTRRIKERDDAAKNRKVADTVKDGNIASGNAPTGAGPVRQDSRSLIAAGLREHAGVRNTDDGDED